jgi:hypothetical protein
MSDIHRPQPINVSAEDVRKGRFHLNPRAEAQRRSQRRARRMWSLLTAFAVFIIALAWRKFFGG